MPDATIGKRVAVSHVHISSTSSAQRGRACRVAGQRRSARVGAESGRAVLLIDGQKAVGTTTESNDQLIDAGHSASSHTADGTNLLRFEQLKDIVIAGDVARVDAGFAWCGLNAALDNTRLTSLPGSNGDTPVVGFTIISGGMSWFGRRYGWPRTRSAQSRSSTPKATIGPSPPNRILT
jgi:hypothetical protein